MGSFASTQRSPASINATSCNSTRQQLQAAQQPPSPQTPLLTTTPVSHGYPPGNTAMAGGYLQPHPPNATAPSASTRSGTATRLPMRHLCCVPVSPSRKRLKKSKLFGSSGGGETTATTPKDCLMPVVNSNSFQTPRSADFSSSTMPITSRAMKVLLVFPHHDPNYEDPVVWAMKCAAEELTLSFDIAYSTDQVHHYYNHSQHDVVFIDRRHRARASSRGTAEDRSSRSSKRPPGDTAAWTDTQEEQNEATRLADALCQWVRKHDSGPCAVVAVEELLENGELPCNMKSLIQLGYDRSFLATEKVSLCVQELLQLEHNNFRWWLQVEATDALRLALDNVADPVEIVDDQFRIQYVNLAYERVLGSSREKLLGQRLPTLGNPPSSLVTSASLPQQHSGKPGEEPSLHVHAASNPPNIPVTSISTPSPPPTTATTTTNNPAESIPSSTSGGRFHFRRGSTGSGQQAGVHNTLPPLVTMGNTTTVTGSGSESNFSAPPSSTATAAAGPPPILPIGIFPPSIMPQLSTSSTFAIGGRAPSLPLTTVRRKSMPDAQQNSVPCRFFPVHSKDGRIIHYVTIRSAPQYASGWYMGEMGNGAPSNMPLIYQRYIPRERHSFTIEAPIHKVISILSSAQQYSNLPVAQELQKVLDILQTTDLYATQKQSVVACREVDPATTDLVEGLLTTSRIFATETDTRRRSNAHAGQLSKRSSRPSEIMTQHIQQVLDNVSNRVNLKGIPEDVSESLEGDDRWDYDILRLEEVTEKRPLKFLALRICERFSVVEVLNTSEATLANWLTVVEDHYRMANTYHNATHAADVMQSSAYFLERDALKDVFGPYDEVATILASIVHDMDHPGRTNPFLVNSRNRLAILYNDMAVLENHHVSLCFQLTDKDERINIFKNLSREDFQLMRQYIIDMVLATEMAKHFEHLTKFMNVVQKKPSLNATSREAKMSDSLTTESLSQRRASGQVNLAGLGGGESSDAGASDPHEEWLQFVRQPDCRANIRRMLIKCSDISNPTRPLRLCKVWAERIAEEYFSQTDEEKSKNLPVVMPWFDRHTCNIPKSQLSFIDFFLKGMIEAWDTFLDVPELVENLNGNHAYWTSLLTKEAAAPAPAPAPAPVAPVKTSTPKGEDGKTAAEDEDEGVTLTLDKKES